MAVRTEQSIEVSLDGKPLGRVKQVYSISGRVEGPLPDWLLNLREDEAKRKILEKKWEQLPEETRRDVRKAAEFIGSLLYHLDAHSLSFNAMTEGKPCTLTISLNK